MSVCVAEGPTLMDVEDVVLTFERATWRVQSEVVSENVAKDRPKNFVPTGSYIFLYKSSGVAGPWLTWPAWYGIETSVDSFCAIGETASDLPLTITTKELIKLYAWVTVVTEYQGIATHFMNNRTKQVYTSDPNEECNYVKAGYIAVPMLPDDAIKRAKNVGVL